MIKLTSQRTKNQTHLLCEATLPHLEEKDEERKRIWSFQEVHGKCHQASSRCPLWLSFRENGLCKVHERSINRKEEAEV